MNPFNAAVIKRFLGLFNAMKKTSWATEIPEIPATNFHKNWRYLTLEVLWMMLWNGWEFEGVKVRQTPKSSRLLLKVTIFVGIKKRENHEKT